MPTLIGLSVSPATERARWALDYAAQPYTFEEYLPGITTPWVRLRTRRLFGPISAPILLGDGLNLPDSWDIAQYAARQQPAAGLIPPAQLNSIAQLNQISEKLFYAGRVLVVERTLDSDAAMLEAIPDFFPAVLHNALLPLTRKAYRDLGTKYADPGRSSADQLRLMAELLTQIRQQLNEKPFLLEHGFSYADITIIAALQVVKPAQSRHIPIGTTGRPCWTCANLAAEFADLLEWRDGVYQLYRYRNYAGAPATPAT